MISNRGKRISGPWCLNWARALALSLTAFLFLDAAPGLTAQLKSALLIRALLQFYLYHVVGNNERRPVYKRPGRPCASVG
jgi:hypothetical protein